MVTATVPRQGSKQMGTAVTSEPMAGSVTVERSVSLRDVNRLADGVRVSHNVFVLLHTDCAPVAAGRRKAMTLVLPGHRCRRRVVPPGNAGE